MAVEPPLRVERREELLWLLVQACELEHGLMCEYLFAQFTLKRSREEGLTDKQLAKVTAWERVLIDVIKQEMLHLALTTNLLTAIGAAPTCTGPTSPFCRAGIRLECRSPWSRSGNEPYAISSTSSAPKAWTSTTPRVWPPSKGRRP